MSQPSTATTADGSAVSTYQSRCLDRLTQVATDYTTKLSAISGPDTDMHSKTAALTEEHFGACARIIREEDDFITYCGERKSVGLSVPTDYAEMRKMDEEARSSVLSDKAKEDLEASFKKNSNHIPEDIMSEMTFAIIAVPKTAGKMLDGTGYRSGLRVSQRGMPAGTYTEGSRVTFDRPSSLTDFLMALTQARVMRNPLHSLFHGMSAAGPLMDERLGNSRNDATSATGHDASARSDAGTATPAMEGVDQAFSHAKTTGDADADSGPEEGEIKAD